MCIQKRGLLNDMSLFGLLRAQYEASEALS